MIFDIKSHERIIFDIIRNTAESLGYPTFVVGGYVRDRLLGRKSKDLDIVCVGDGMKLAESVANQLSPRPKVAFYSRFGTAMLRYRDMEIEFVGARRESYRYDSRNPLVESGSLEDDQNRRDFTINAMAVSLNKNNYGEIIDPFNGIRHLELKIIKTPLLPSRTFSDDPLRMMRAIRFAAQLNFTIIDEAFDAIYKNRNRLKIVSTERIMKEFEKILLTETPSKGIKMLMDSGLLEIFFPEMTNLKGVEIRNGQRHKDNFYHTLQVLDNLCKKTNKLWLRWAAIMHDIAKPPTKRFDPKTGWTFHGHEALGAAMVPRIFKRLRLPTDTNMKYVQKLVRLHLRPISLTKENITDSAIRRLIFEAGDDIDDLMLLCEADITSKNPAKVKRYLSNYELVRERIELVEKRDHLRNWQPPISGEVIMTTFDIPPSRKVGIIKNAIREAILDGIIPNEYDLAFEFMLKEGEKMGL